MNTANRMNDAVKQAAATTRHAAATTAHAIGNLAEEAQHKIEDLDLPVLPKRRSRSKRRWIALALLVALAGVVVAKRRSDGADDDRQATDSGAVAPARDAALTSVG